MIAKLGIKHHNIGCNKFL